MHVFGGGRSQNERVWLTSDVALRNGGDTGLDEAWWIYEEAVYDVSLYAHMHPGGSKLILDKAGRDATSEFRTAHSANIKEFVALMEVYRVGSLAPPPPATDMIIWTQLVQLLHFATEIVNVVRGEAQVLLRVQTTRSGITQPPQHEQLVAYQKIVHRGGYVDRIVLGIADVMKAIGGACPVQLRPRFLTAANRARQWSSQSNDSITLEEIGESPDVSVRPSDARERVLAHRSAAGKHNFDPTGHALGEELLNTARAGLENVRKELILMLQQIEERGSLQEYSVVPEASVGEMLLGHLQSSFDLCVALYTKVASALIDLNPAAH
ncbi:hypothetical protein AB1Y20_021464 [Prymnesium parvum]|uniref:Cytochrome b5 heme-binding domain-containing protein n=1 Tax=Prymnesium parvum TaxID=97485 RepID=A0AB34JLM2_PRYPA